MFKVQAEKKIYYYYLLSIKKKLWRIFFFNGIIIQRCLKAIMCAMV